MTKPAAKLSPFWAERLFPSAFVQANPLRAIANQPTELKPTGHSPEEIRRWIVAICRRLSTTPTELARSANLAPSTINRFLSGKGSNENVSASTLEKLTKVASEKFENYINETLEFNKFGDQIEVEADWSGKNFTTFDQTIVEIPIVAYIFSEFWTSQKELDKADHYRISIPVHKSYANLPLIGLEMRGGTSNTKYPNQSILVCVPFYALDREPIDREFIIANQKRPDDEVEIIVRQYREEIFPGDAQPFRRWLVALEGEHLFLPPIDITYRGNNDSLIVSFLVVASFQPERRLYKRPKEFDPVKREAVQKSA